MRGYTYRDELKEAFKVTKTTRKELASYLDITPTTLSKYLSGNHEISIYTQKKIIEFFLQYQYLLEFDLSKIEPLDRLSEYEKYVLEYARDIEQFLIQRTSCKTHPKTTRFLSDYHDKEFKELARSYEEETEKMRDGESLWIASNSAKDCFLYFYGNNSQIFRFRLDKYHTLHLIENLLRCLTNQIPL